MSNNDLTSASALKAEREVSEFQSSETLFIPINRHVTWKSHFFQVFQLVTACVIV